MGWRSKLAFAQTCNYTAHQVLVVTGNGAVVVEHTAEHTSMPFGIRQVC